VTVRPSTVLALLLWDVVDTGGYPITYFTARYREKYNDAGKELDHWHSVMPEHISPNVVSENRVTYHKAVFLAVCYSFCNFILLLHLTLCYF
jgi:hypothetical protein